MNVLLLEDDPIIAREIKQYLEKHDFTCDCVYDGIFVSDQLQTKLYDFIILDINVPSKNGLDICRDIRISNKKTPILMLTAFGQISNKTIAFENGADDYLVKPFNLQELLIRIKSLLRRSDHEQSNEQVVRIGDLEIYLDKGQIMRNNKIINLTPKEFKLLNILAKANGRILSKQQIADQLWDYHIESSFNTIEVYVNFLRNKIDKDCEDKLIHTKVGYGYFLKSL